RSVLLDVLDPYAPSRSVADSRPDLRAGVADDDADVADAGGGNRLDAVEEHRLVGHRHELLGAGVGQRTKPGALPAAENQSFHATLTAAGRGGRRSLRTSRGRPGRRRS